MLDLKNLFGVEISSFVDFLQESVEEDSEGNEEDLGGPISGCKIENDTGYGGIGILTTAQNRHYATTCYHVCYKNDDFRQTRDQNKKHKILLEDYNIHNSQGCQGVTCRYKKDERPFGEFYCGLYADEHDIALIQLKPDLDCSTMPKFLEGKNIRLTLADKEEIGDIFWPNGKWPVQIIPPGKNPVKHGNLISVSHKGKRRPRCYRCYRIEDVQGKDSPFASQGDSGSLIYLINGNEKIPFAYVCIVREEKEQNIYYCRNLSFSIDELIEEKKLDDSFKNPCLQRCSGEP